MVDKDLIARVYPFDDRKEYITKAFRSSSRYVAPLAQSAEPGPTRSRRRRGSTEPPDLRDVPDHDYLPYIKARFSDVPRSHRGIVFGTDPDSDVVLPNCTGIGYHHFSLTFDHANRLIIKDWGSLIGTEITYNGQGRGVRSQFQWIVGGHPIPQLTEQIIITLHSDPQIKLQIIVAQHETTSLEYIDQVDRFLQGSATAEDLFADLDIPKRWATKWPTGAHTPGTGEIYLRKKIGEGSFAVVTHHWNVSTGEEFALKEPSVKALREGWVKISDWKNERHIMGLISHPNIVQLLGSDFTRSSRLQPEHPRLYLEYIPGGSLANQHGISAAECILILRQCLSALMYLHGRNLTIVHRDIKTDNILVQYRDLDHIEVKLADFGISKDYDNLSTICGNRRHLAPEVYLIDQFARAGGEGRVSYNSAVDIWSLGTVVYGLLCRLPRWEERYAFNGTTWAEKIIETFEKDFREQPDHLRQFLLETMVVMRPEERWPAEACHARAELLPVPVSDRRDPPTPASHTGESEQATIHYQGNQSTIKDQQNVTRQAASSDKASGSTGVRRYAEPVVPPFASSIPMSQKRPTTVSASSSPPRRSKHQKKGGSTAGSPSYVTGNHIRDQSGRHCPQSKSRVGLEADPWNASPGGDGRVHAPQIDNDSRDQEAFDAAVLRQTMKQDLPIDHNAGSLPEALSKASHMSTRDLIFDRSGLVYMVIWRHKVSMRTSDYRLNAFQILSAAGTDKTKRDIYLRILKRREAIERTTEKGAAWVPFRDGVFLCQAVGLQSELEPLLSYARLVFPERDENYFLVCEKHRRRQLDERPVKGYAALLHNNRVIAYKPVERTVNATHLLKLGDIPLPELAKFLKKTPSIMRKVHRHGDTNILGTYVSYEDALVLSAHFKLSLDPVKRLIELASSPGERQQLPNQPQLRDHLLDEHFSSRQSPEIPVQHSSPANGLPVLEAYQSLQTHCSKQSYQSQKCFGSAISADQKVSAHRSFPDYENRSTESGASVYQLGCGDLNKDPEKQPFPIQKENEVSKTSLESQSSAENQSSSALDGQYDGFNSFFSDIKDPPTENKAGEIHQSEHTPSFGRIPAHEAKAFPYTLVGPPYGSGSFEMSPLMQPVYPNLQPGSHISSFNPGALAGDTSPFDTFRENGS